MFLSLFLVKCDVHRMTIIIAALFQFQLMLKLYRDSSYSVFVSIDYNQQILELSQKNWLLVNPRCTFFWRPILIYSVTEVRLKYRVPTIFVESVNVCPNHPDSNFTSRMNLHPPSSVNNIRISKCRIFTDYVVFKCLLRRTCLPRNKR